jgi:hypothetical protein
MRWMLWQKQFQVIAFRAWFLTCLDNAFHSLPNSLKKQFENKTVSTWLDEKVCH